ncbi:MAG: aldehyde dehydrogenase family protein [Rhodospirillales bacterium]
MLDKTTPDLNFSPKGLYIGGEWQESAGNKTFESINPSNREKLADIPDAQEKDVQRAVAKAKAAFEEWRRVPIAERARCLETLARRIEEHAEELALMDAVDAGNSLGGMRGDMEWTAGTLRYFAGLITEIKGESSSQDPRHLNVTRRQPYGVVAKINAFNHPFRFCAEKAAAPLAAGNCVVIKGSEQAPLSSLRLGELCEGIFPKGVVNIVTGGVKAGAALVTHPDISRIGFVGSVPTGRIIAKAAAETLKVVSLELGGKNPIIIFPDADPVKAATAAIKGMNMNRQGQSCSSTSRVFVHESLHGAVTQELVKQAEALPMGPPWIDGNEVGPIVSERQYDRILGFIKSAEEEGADCLTGGGPPDDAELRKGFFVLPTIYDRVTPEMRIGREEIFGPVMSVISWSDDEAMLEAVNGVEYGLTAAIITNDLAKAMETAERVEAGYVWINSTGRYIGAPYGGWKQSGIGQEECFDELLSYTRIKNINMRW